MVRDDMRAGDGDRQEVADKLRAALEEGRLDLNEYDERLQKTLAAKTYGDLNGLLDDLPGTVPVQQSQVTPHQSASITPAAASASERNVKQFGPYAGVFVMTVVIWAISSIATQELLYFWPIWVAIPLLFGIVGQVFGGGSGGKGRGPRKG